MTRKDYIILAEALRRAYPADCGQSAKVLGIQVRQHDRGLSEICDALQSDNPRFDVQKFCAAVREG